MLIDVDSELEEKEAAVKLEEVTSVLYEQHDGGVICSFTVIANNMAALESTEHVDYDAIFVAEGRSLSYNFVNKRGANGNNKNSNKATGGDTSEIAAYDILRILRMVGSTTPVILLTSSHDLAYSNSIYKSSTPGLPAIGFHTCTDRFAAVLQRPYRSKDICHIISQIIATNTSDSETITGDSLSELDELTGKESHNRARAEPLSKAPRTSASSASINSSSSSTLPALSAFHHTTSSTSTSSSVYTLMGQYAGSRFQNNGSGKGHNT